MHLVFMSINLTIWSYFFLFLLILLSCFYYKYHNSYGTAVHSTERILTREALQNILSHSKCPQAPFWLFANFVLGGQLQLFCNYVLIMIFLCKTVIVILVLPRSTGFKYNIGAAWPGWIDDDVSSSELLESLNCVMKCPLLTGLDGGRFGEDIPVSECCIAGCGSRYLTSVYYKSRSKKINQLYHLYLKHMTTRNKMVKTFQCFWKNLKRHMFFFISIHQFHEPWIVTYRVYTTPLGTCYLVNESKNVNTKWARKKSIQVI